MSAVLDQYVDNVALIFRNDDYYKSQMCPTSADTQFDLL